MDRFRIDQDQVFHIGRPPRYPVSMPVDFRFPQLGVVTTTSPQTVTIQEWNCNRDTLIDWGDGSTTLHPANSGATVSRIYAVAGSYTIRLIVNPLAVRRVDFRHVALRPDTQHLRRCTGITYFRCSDAPIAVINSTHMADWRPTTWYCFSLPAGSTVNIDSTHMVDWRPTLWRCYSLPAGSTVNIDSAHMVDWRPTLWYCYFLPAGRVITVAAANFAGWVECSGFLANDNALLEAQVDAILEGLYTAFASRTATAGTINVGGTNAAPTGTYQQPEDCGVGPVSGKERAYELLNDFCDVAPAPANQWGTVTTS
jgi:hypothetical protein